MHAQIRAPRPLGRRFAASAAGVVLAVTGTLLSAPHAGAAEAATEPAGDVTMIQANIYSGLTVPKFQADVKKVLDLAPDFITYNEVPLRNDLVMAPPSRGYAIHRNMRNRYTASTAVAWRTDRWTKIASGTERISNWRGKPPGRNIELGRRFANWVRLQSPDGRVVSVVAVHVAPLVNGMPDLRRRSVVRIGELVDRLSPAGPVLVGGDFNIHYRASIYPRTILTEAGMVPTYDMLKSWFPTGDHRGATIDYLFNRTQDQMWAAGHRAMELNSDHDAVIAGFDWTVDAPAETQAVTNQPNSDDPATRRSAVTTLRSQIRAAEAGGTVEIVTAELEQWGLARAARNAVARGVHVRLTTSSRELTPRERTVRRAIEASGDPASSVTQCFGSCRDGWRAASGPRGLLMVAKPSGAWTVRTDSSRAFVDLVERATTLTVRTGKFGLAAGEALLDTLP